MLARGQRLELICHLPFPLRAQHVAKRVEVLLAWAQTKPISQIALRRLLVIGEKLT